MQKAAQDLPSSSLRVRHRTANVQRSIRWAPRLDGASGIGDDLDVLSKDNIRAILNEMDCKIDFILVAAVSNVADSLKAGFPKFAWEGRKETLILQHHSAIKSSRQSPTPNLAHWGLGRQPVHGPGRYLIHCTVEPLL
ncbi:hypothetical protein BD779DRAFT_1685640 [Infundibulicybe gibba]|nr:hypothetical protein BD779DRAFT_1685640 [Infundibulicybe gibba]